jgi:hypothetical protein
VEFEQMDDFEKELQQALERRPAPPGLKGKILQRRGLRTIERRHSFALIWQRVAAGLLVGAMLGGGLVWQMQRAEERRKGEEARRQVMIALRITGHALKEMNTRLAAHDRGGDE